MSYQNVFCENIVCDTINNEPIPVVDENIPKSILYYGSLSLPVSSVRALRLLNTGGGSGTISGVSNTTTTIMICPINIADFPIIYGKTPKLRLNYMVATNSTAPNSTFTAGLYAITSTTGTTTQMIVTSTSSLNPIGGVVAIVSSPGASTITQTLSSLISIPPNGMYCIGIENGLTPISLTTHTVVLELIYQ